MDHLIGMMLGGLLGWTATLFLEHRRWLPSRGDLTSGVVGGLFGSLSATVMGLPLADEAAANLSSLAALAGAGVAIALWRASRGAAPRRDAGEAV